MHWFPFLTLAHFSAFIIYSTLAFLILRRNNHSHSNIYAFATLILFAFWSLGKMFLHNPGTPYGMAVFLEKADALAWCTFPVTSLWFMVSLTDDKNHGNKPFFSALSAITAVSFILLSWTGMLMDSPVKTAYGWSSQWRHNAASYAYYAYYFLCIMTGMVFMFINVKKSPNPNKKNQIRLLLWASSVTLAFGTAAEAVLPLARIDAGVLGDITNLYILAWGGGIYYALLRYNFLALTPVTAADSIISGMHECLILLDEDLKVSFMNRTGYALTGYNEREVKNRPFDIFLEDKSAFGKIITGVVLNDFYKDDNFLLKDKNGKTIPVIFSAAVIREMNEMRGIACVASDISSLKNTQEELKKSYDRLKDLSDQKENFTSFVSHELRSPLTSINGFISVLLKDAAKLDNTQLEYLEIIRNNSHRLLKLLNDLLDSSKMESGKFTINKSPCLLPLTIRAVQQELGAQLEKNGMRVTIDAAKQEDPFLADSGRIHQVLVNLLNNSIKYSPRGASVEISLKFMDHIDSLLPAHMGRKAPVNGKYAVISVSDTGSGIAPEHLNEIFEKYSRIENKGRLKPEGTGLGLSIVKHIIELHEGLVWAESGGLNKGSKFTFILPS